ncbi:hypothetical protein [Porphyrobacter sp. GA68]|uniref:hypothetical protein n=1 Tax=Porphyrobacter sp. GA68 TaxID=2883480 RepID=UPI001D181A5C|nr:hypothetical protein [Porphyrobacter sp. GA68]
MSVLRRFAAVLRDGVRIWWLAPVIPLLIVLPEFAQHVAEIRLGMFDGGEIARAAASDPARWVFGYTKIAGLLLAILATIRCWGSHGRPQRWWNLRDVRWSAVALALLLIALSAVPGWLVEPVLGDPWTPVIDVVLMLAALPSLVLLVAGLAGDRDVTLRAAFATRAGWLSALRMIVFAAAVWTPLQWLHGANHRWAMGAAEPVVWALMVWDSLVVGLLATMAGTALHHGWRLPEGRRSGVLAAA